LVGFDALLSEAYGFDLTTGFGYDNVGFGGMVGCALGFIIAAYSRFGQSWVAF
jgi:hypothetical protein